VRKQERVQAEERRIPANAAPPATGGIEGERPHRAGTWDAQDRHRLVPSPARERHQRFNWHGDLVAPTVGRVDANLAYLLRPGLLGDVIQDEIPELEVIVDGIEFELAILKADPPRPLLARGVQSIEVGLSEGHKKVSGLDRIQKKWDFKRKALR
jgi:hypothetical protein